MPLALSEKPAKMVEKAIQVFKDSLGGQDLEEAKEKSGFKVTRDSLDFLEGPDLLEWKD